MTRYSPGSPDRNVYVYSYVPAGRKLALTFPDAPPQTMWAVLYEYRFTNRLTRRATGDWWQSEFVGLYVRPVTLSIVE